MKVTFWGVRGSVGTSGPHVARIGGNTTCLEIEHGGERIIIDAGTGVRPLGDKLFAEAAERGGPVVTNLLFTHLHWDHIQGFPFFGPAFVPGNHLSLYGPREGDFTLEATLRRQMRPPSFPVPLEIMGADMSFTTVDHGDTFEIGPFTVTALGLDHPQGCLGYRIAAGNATLCFATDTEHREDGALGDAILHLARDVDLLIHDGQYTQAEYDGRVGPPRKGWGHSTHTAAADIARAVGARGLALFHHDPSHDDDTVEAMAREVWDRFHGAIPAREGLTLEL